MGRSVLSCPIKAVDTDYNPGLVKCKMVFFREKMGPRQSLARPEQTGRISWQAGMTGMPNVGLASDVLDRVYSMQKAPDAFDASGACTASYVVLAYMAIWARILATVTLSSVEPLPGLMTCWILGVILIQGATTIL